jgi:hypothetical protein
MVSDACTDLPRINELLLSYEKQILYGVWALAKQCGFARLS